MGMTRKSLEQPDETRAFGKGKLQIVSLGKLACGRATFEPGWKWSENVKPIAKTDSCQVHHVGYVISGHMKIKMDDGSMTDVGPGDAMDCPPGHDAWVVGNEACVIVEIGEATNYAKPA